MQRLFPVKSPSYDFFTNEVHPGRIIYQFCYTQEELNKIKNYLFDFDDNDTAHFIYKMLDTLSKQESSISHENFIFISNQDNGAESLYKKNINEKIALISDQLTMGQKLLSELNVQLKKDEFNLLSGALIYCKKQLEHFLRAEQENSPSKLLDFISKEINNMLSKQFRSGSKYSI